MSCATTKSQRINEAEVACDLLVGCDLRFQAALEGSGYAVQTGGGETGRMRRCVVPGPQHLVFSEVWNSSGSSHVLSV